MNEINVIYQSRGGNTEVIAKAIAEECGVAAYDIESAVNVSGSDLLFVGMGIYAGKPDSSLLDYLDQLPVNVIKGAAVFTTSATGGEHAALVINLLEHKGIQVYPRHLNVKGKFLFMNKGKPGKDEVKEARDFAREVLDAFNG
ncbi:MAG: hypothetical protein IJ225_12010 [Solobacterium sp.]|nr:hypothetical protein [Solobacterium sp.]